jgi:putative PIN family toxin of toxin-antitoxin system
VVLDTNVLLSLFVFADSRYAPLRGRLESGAWRALTDSRCLHEFQRVLAYPMFSLDAAAQLAAYDAYARLATVVAAPLADPVDLPECEDPDDQKFLELARDGKAQWLVTSDKALLKLGRRRKLAHLFGIVTPNAALAIDLHA